MTMMGSLNTGVSALKSFQRGMEVVGHDIANVNTAGFKSQRMEYKDAFYDTLNRSFQGEDPEFGVTHTANQVGTGVRADTISTDFSQGMLQNTSIDSDLAIFGNGFFKVIDETTDPANPETYFTRAGNFRIDNEGYLVTQAGHYVQGLTAGDSPTVNMTVTGSTDGQGLQASGFEVPAGSITEGTGAFTVGSLALPADFNGGSGYFSPTNGLPKVTIIGDGAGATAEAVVTNGVVTGINITSAGSGYSNAVVRIEQPPASDLRYTVQAQPDISATGRIRVLAPNMDVSGFATDTAQLNQANVEALVPGMQGYAIGENGDVNIILDNGDSVTVGRVLLQNFRDPQALTRHEGGLYSNEESAGIENNFGSIDASPGLNGLGIIRQGTLELSNSDMTENFANLITTQRSFQGAARVITTSDEVLQEAVNLKR